MNGETILSARQLALLRFVCMSGRASAHALRVHNVSRGCIESSVHLGLLTGRIAGARGTIYHLTEEGRRLICAASDQDSFADVNERSTTMVRKTSTTKAKGIAVNPSRLTAKSACVAVLTKEGGPLATKEIARRALEEEGLVMGGKTPAASIAAELYTLSKKGELFKQTGRGIFDLVTREEGTVDTAVVQKPTSPAGAKPDPKPRTSSSRSPSRRLATARA